MPVRSSLCAYSPAATSTTMGTLATSKYSAILPTTSSLSYGHYKPLSSNNITSSSPVSSRAGSFRPTSSSQYERPATYSSPSSGARVSRSSFTSRYAGLGSGSPSSYSPTSSSALSSSSISPSGGLYKPLESPTSRTYSTGTSLGNASGSRRFSSSSNTLGQHDSNYLGPYSAYKSPSTSASSAYSSGSSLSSTSSGLSSTSTSSSATSSGYVPRSRRLSYTSYSTGSSAGSHRSSPGVTEFNAASPHSPKSPTASATKSPQLPPGVPGGLINLGNTCYMNASIQALYSIEAFREPILSGALRVNDKVLSSQLADLFKLLRASNANGQAVSPADFKYAFSTYQSKFAGFAQQDAQEFLRYLINGVHEEFNRARNSMRRSGGSAARPLEAPRSSEEAWSQYRAIVDDSPLVDLLVGQLCSTITCSECNNKSHCWDPFWDLSLPLVSMRPRSATASYSTLTSGRNQLNLRDIIEEFTAKETLDGDERPTCQHCKRATRSTKQISWSRLPQVLLLHLKKFTNDGYKLSSGDIHIDKQLTFSGHSATYKLRAAISHHGHSSSSGHYTSHCDYNGRWFHFDDARVRDVTGQLFEAGRLSDAYVLLYTPTTSTLGHSKL